MSQDKFVELQHQMRENQSELQDYLKDLDSWTQDVKKKDDELKTEPQQAETDNTTQLPPVRNSLHKPKKKKKKKAAKTASDAEKKSETAGQTAEKPRISGYDFKAWDKFDVDAACAEVDEQKSSSSSSEYETDDEWEEERKKQQAVMLKDQGNQLFKEGRYEEAIECYTRGIECDSKNALLPANRAMALLKQEKYGAAILDCTAAISLDTQYVKAYMRRGTARAALNMLTQAKEDFNQVLKMEPNNQQALKEVAKIEKKLNPHYTGPAQSTIDPDCGMVKAVYKPPHLRSKKPLRRIQIEDLGAPQVAPHTGHSDNLQKLADQQAAGFDQFVQNSSTPVLTDSMEGEMTPNDNTSSKDESKNNIPDSPAEAGDNNTRPNSKHELSSTKDSEKHDKQQPIKTAVPTESTTTSKICRQMAPPVSSYQFQADWKMLRNTSEEFYLYFKQIPVSNYKRIFGDVLDAEILLKVFATLKKYYIRNNEDVLPVLQNLCDVSRFSITVLFLSDKDKQALKSLFKHLQSQENGPEQTDLLNSLSSKYGL